MNRAPLDRIAARRRRLSSALVVPAAVTALVVCAVEGSRILRPDSPLFATDFVFSLAEAIERDDLDGAFAFIRSGQDPNAPISVRHPTLTDGETLLVPPLLWAVSTNRPRLVALLLGHGARMDIPGNADATCLADVIGASEAAALIRRTNPDAASRTCGERRTDVPPLVAFASAR